MNWMRLGSVALGVLFSLTSAASAESNRPLAGIVFGETAGLRPLDGHESSRRQLREARRWIARVAIARRHRGVARPVYPTIAEQRIPYVMDVWSACQRAADLAPSLASSSVDGRRVLHFLIRQGGSASAGGQPARPAWARGHVPIMSFGPFRCVGGGDVPRGDETYIDFFAGID